MKYTAIRLAVSLLTFIIGTAAALVSPWRSAAPPSAAAEQEVLRVERQYIQANLEGDTATLDEILADDFSIRARGGMVTNKPERLALFADPFFAFEVIRTDNVRATVTGDKAVVTGDVFIRNGYGHDRSDGASYTYSREYEKRDGRWQIVTMYLRP